uniref:PKD domain-containing protein n=1 Tax=Xiphophorus couchianus TaxID=32473 RepID=A0A3B5MXQ6_9TELE
MLGTPWILIYGLIYLCFTGGNVTFDLKNDAPTLTGAKATFTISLNFPPNQTVLPDGQVVWARNCTVNGREYQEGQAVYPDRGGEWTGVFPDGTPFNRSQNRKPCYVFVWKTFGRYWQVADGPSSSLTIGTDDVPLGSYNMELVIYHCRGRDRFIPLGYASSVFTITDQVPFSLSLSQVNDVNQNDQNFIQNQAIAFTVALHDPSQYLNSADIRFSWDFGDNSGTFISREHTVTHTYLSVGAFRPQVVLMASIPCGNPTHTCVSFLKITGFALFLPAAPIDASAGPAVVVVASSPAPPAAAEGEDATALDHCFNNPLHFSLGEQTAEAEDEGEGEVQAEVEADPTQVVLVVAKRQAPAENCIIDRYGSLTTSVDVVQGIDSVEIVQMSNVVSMATELDQNAVDVTISCQGSLPSEVCTVISDADCITPVQTVCGAASPSPDCQMILRQFFNDTGVFCLNVSLTNDVSLAVATATKLTSECCLVSFYQPLTEERGAGNGGSFVTSVPLLLWNLLSRQSPGESRPLLQGRIV